MECPLFIPFFLLFVVVASVVVSVVAVVVILFFILSVYSFVGRSSLRISLSELLLFAR